MRLHKILSRAVLLLLPALAASQAWSQPLSPTQWRGETVPRLNIKTNLLYDATGTINLGVEVRTGNYTSIDLSGNYNGWSLRGDRKWKHILVQPEMRWWHRGTFNGHFLGVHGHWALYNVGRLPNPPFTKWMNTHRFEGWLAGAGINYGYRWNFSRRWAMEATVGVGYAYLDYKRFECGRCGDFIETKRKHYFGPTKAGITLIFGVGGGKGQPASTLGLTSAPAPATIATVQSPARVHPPKSLKCSFITPAVEEVKMRSESGEAYVNFEVGRLEIVADFMDNSSELRKIYSSLERIRNNYYATITGMTIVGHSSPDGSYADNMRLSRRRTESLKSHLCAIYGIDPSVVVTRGEGEDWAGLESLVAQSNIPDKALALELVSAPYGHDTREARLRAALGGSIYKRLSAEFYPRLRRVDYTINYTVEPFDAEKGKQVFQTRPGDLSLAEFFIIAATYPEGSDEFSELFETAARLFPSNDVANINAAASTLSRGDAVSATRHLERVRHHGGEWHNNMGVLAWLRGDAAAAAQHFAAAGEHGIANAAQLAKHAASTGKEKSK